MKKLLVFLLVAMLAITGCSQDSSTGSDDGEITIGYAINNMNDTFQTYIFDAAKAKAEEYGYKIEIQDSQEDVVRQQDQVKAMLEQGVDALIVVPVDTSAMEPLTNAAVEAGIH